METTKTANDRQLVECPHCGETIILWVKARAGVEIPKSDEEGDWESRLSPEQRRVLHHARSSGILDHFASVTQKVRGKSTPKNMERFFLRLMETVRPLKLPRVILNKLISAFPNQKIECWGDQGVAFILTDDMIRGCIAQDVLMGVRVRSTGGGKTKMRMRADPRELDSWIRTRYGFVSHPGAMFESLRVRSHGEFNRG